MLVIFVVGKLWERMTAKSDQEMAVASACDEDDQSSSSKSKPQSKAAMKLALARLNMLGRLTNSELDSLLYTKKAKKVALDAFVYRPQTPSSAFFYIKSGSFKIVDQSGVETIKSEGQIFGDTDFLTRSDRADSAQCVSVGSDGKAMLVVFLRSALLYILGKRHDFAVSDSEDSDSDADSYSEARGKDRGKEVSAASPPPHAIVRFDDVFCGAARLP